MRVSKEGRGKGMRRLQPGLPVPALDATAAALAPGPGDVLKERGGGQEGLIHNRII